MPAFGSILVGLGFVFSLIAVSLIALMGGTGGPFWEAFWIGFGPGAPFVFLGCGFRTSRLGWKRVMATTNLTLRFLAGLVALLLLGIQAD